MYSRKVPTLFPIKHPHFSLPFLSVEKPAPRRRLTRASQNRARTSRGDCGGRTIVLLSRRFASRRRAPGPGPRCRPLVRTSPTSVTLLFAFDALSAFGIQTWSSCASWAAWWPRRGHFSFVTTYRLPRLARGKMGRSAAAVRFAQPRNRSAKCEHGRRGSPGSGTVLPASWRKGQYVWRAVWCCPVPRRAATVPRETKGCQTKPTMSNGRGN